MKDKRLLTGLQKLFWIAGWAMIALTIFGAVATIQSSSHEVQIDGVTPAMRDFFFVLSKFRVLVNGIAEAFFALLVSTVFGMIVSGQSAKTDQSNRFLLLTCWGLVGQSFLSLISVIHTVVQYPFMGLNNPSFYIKFMSVLGNVMSAAQSLVPILYAVTIYVLYRHFTRMVTFEAEVI